MSHNGYLYSLHFPYPTFLSGN